MATLSKLVPGCLVGGMHFSDNCAAFQEKSRKVLWELTAAQVDFSWQWMWCLYMFLCVIVTCCGHFGYKVILKGDVLFGVPWADWELKLWIKSSLYQCLKHRTWNPKNNQIIWTGCCKSSGQSFFLWENKS